MVLRASDAQAQRLQQIGYDVEQLQLTENYLTTFATAEAISGYHSAETLEEDLRQLATTQPEIAELRELRRSLEDRPI
jgi:carboxypeptidase T